MKITNLNFKKTDIILVAIILIIACSIFIFYKQNNSLGKRVRVRIDKEVYKIYPLNKDVDEIIKIDNSNFNRLIIKNGVARISEANCPDKICTHQKPINRQGETLVCLPHKLIVDILDDNSNEHDGLDSISS